MLRPIGILCLAVGLVACGDDPDHPIEPETSDVLLSDADAPDLDLDRPDEVSVRDGDVSILSADEQYTAYFVGDYGETSGCGDMPGWSLNPDLTIQYYEDGSKLICPISRLERDDKALLLHADICRLDGDETTGRTLQVEQIDRKSVMISDRQSRITVTKCI